MRPMSSTSTSSPSNPFTALNRTRLVRLRLHWLLIAVSYVLITAAGFTALVVAWSPVYALRWLLITSLILIRELWLLWSGLPRNHRAGEDELLSTLGWGNALTVGRGLLVALLAGFILSPPPTGVLGWAPALLYMAAGILDNLDGYVARITNHSTELGEMLDMEYDVIGIFAAVVLGISYGQLPLWYLVVGFARELFLLGHWVLRRLGKQVYDLPPSPDRRLIAGMQMGFLGVALWPVITPPVTTVAAVLFALPMIVSFGRDRMVTSGGWDVTTVLYQRRRLATKRWLEGRLPILARAVGALGGAALLRREAPDFVAWQQVLSSSGALWLLAAFTGLLLLLFALGILGRMAGLVLTAVACFDAYVYGFDWMTNGVLLVGALYVLQFGSGNYSVWQPEDRRLRRRAGDPRVKPV